MRGIAQVMTFVLCLATPGLADAPPTSIRPMLRPIAAPSVTPSAAQLGQLATASTLRPRARPAQQPSEGFPPLADEGSYVPSQAMMFMAPVASVPIVRPRSRPAIVTADAAPPLAIMNTTDLVSVPRPHLRPTMRDPGGPEQLEQAAVVRILPGKSAVIGRKGSVCGDPSIKGEVLAPITSRVHGCGVADPVRVTSVDGVTLTPSAVLDCDTARALTDWVSTGLKPAFGRKEVASLQIAGSYSCRTRNNIRGAPISEHGSGKAIDVAAIALTNGSTITVASDWRRQAGKPMKAAYRAACGTFGTTLSPDADRYHRDHMHFDTAHQRGGPYCR